jgi:hypothetical protein
MAKYVVIRVHHNDAKEIVGPLKGKPTHIIVEAFQRGLAKRGKPTGLTYKVVEGSLVDALIETAGV